MCCACLPCFRPKASINPSTPARKVEQQVDKPSDFFPPPAYTPHSAVDIVKKMLPINIRAAYRNEKFISKGIDYCKRYLKAYDAYLDSQTSLIDPDDPNSPNTIDKLTVKSEVQQTNMNRFLDDNIKVMLDIPTEKRYQLDNNFHLEHKKLFVNKVLIAFTELKDRLELNRSANAVTPAAHPAQQGSLKLNQPYSKFHDELNSVATTSQSLQDSESALSSNLNDNLHTETIIEMHHRKEEFNSPDCSNTKYSKFNDELDSVATIPQEISA